LAGDSSPGGPTFSPSSSPSPPRREDSGDETGFIAHTQHLVDVMEARIQQKTAQKTESKSRLVDPAGGTKAKAVRRQKSGGGGGKAAVEAAEQERAAMEAWHRRKNYDPMAAAGRKKEAGRKQSAGSRRSPGAEPVRAPASPAKRQGPSPASALSRSSDSSGYLSRTECRPRAGPASPGARAAPAWAPGPASLGPPPAPGRLASSSLQGQVRGGGQGGHHPPGPAQQELL
jgi:hypothetical protein